ncbi:MAG: ribosome maturation factor RimP [Clostridiales bacterium]|nr:ribosome maturation factor RimP [Clostridiales bacterium]
MAKVKQICEEKLRPIVEEMGYELVEVSYEKENGGMSLIFTIDKDGGVSIDDCEIVNKKIDPILDELNPTDDKPYTLVVSSPGLDRPLKTDRDLTRGLETEVELSLFSKIDGKKLFVGVLKAFDEETVSLQTEKETLTFEREKVASIKRVIKF